MGYTPSSSTQTLYAYLTQKGRYNLLFSSATASQVKYFSLHDDDINYRVSAINNNKLPRGFVPDITGDDDNCIRSVAQAHVVDESNYLIWGGTLTPPPPPTNPPPPPTNPPPPPTNPPPPPPTGQRTLPLILEFEYAKNYETTNNINDVWVHQRIADPNDGSIYRSELGQNVKIDRAVNPIIVLGNQDPKFAIVLRTSPGDTLPITQAERDAVRFNLTLSYFSPISSFYGTTGSKMNRFNASDELNYVSFSYDEGEFRTAAQSLGSANPSKTYTNFISNYSFSSVTTNALVNKLTKMYLYWSDGAISNAGDPNFRQYFQFKFTLSLPQISTTYQVNPVKNEYEYRGAIIKAI